MVGPKWVSRVAGGWGWGIVGIVERNLLGIVSGEGFLLQRSFESRQNTKSNFNKIKTFAHLSFPFYVCMCLECTM